MGVIDTVFLTLSPLFLSSPSVLSLSIPFLASLSIVDISSLPRLDLSCRCLSASLFLLFLLFLSQEVLDEGNGCGVNCATLTEEHELVVGRKEVRESTCTTRTHKCTKHTHAHKRTRTRTQHMHHTRARSHAHTHTHTHMHHCVVAVHGLLQQFSLVVCVSLFVYTFVLGLLLLLTRGTRCLLRIRMYALACICARVFACALCVSLFQH